MFSIEEWYNGKIKLLQEEVLDFPGMPEKGLPRTSYNMMIIEEDNIDELLKLLQDYVDAKRR